MRYLNEERKLWKKGHKKVVGLDEAGRGPLAGPVVAAAVMIKRFPVANFQFLGINDSKKLSAKKREEFYKIITKHPAIEWGIGKVSEKVIDKINIFQATKLAMKRATNNLERKHSLADFLILDGKISLDLPIAQKSIVKADEKVFSCMAAGILAKVWRDRIMRKYHLKYPGYGFAQHKGYPTKYHRKMLKKHGRCVIHRLSFKLRRNYGCSKTKTHQIKKG